MRRADRKTATPKRRTQQETKSTAYATRRQRLWHLGAAAVLIVAGLVVYSNSIGNPFVFDDHPSIVDNPHIRGLWPLTETLTGPPESGANGRPVVALSLALNYRLSGLDVWSYHLFNIGVHHPPLPSGPVPFPLGIFRTSFDTYSLTIYKRIDNLFSG